MKRKTPMRKLIPVAALSLALAGQSAMALPDLLIGPGATQPGGDPTDTTVNWGIAWSTASAGSGSAEYADGVSSSNNITGSILFVFDAVGGAAQDPANMNSPNVELVTSMTPGVNSTWLGNPAFVQYDLSKYAAVSFDVKVNTLVSSNVNIPVTIMGAAYDWCKVAYTAGQANGQVYDPTAATNGWGLGATNAGWTHVRLPLTPDIIIPDAVTFGGYLWYNTDISTPPAHVEYWMDNIRLEAAHILPPPPTLAVKPLKHTGLLIDPGPSSGRQQIKTSLAAASYAWEGNASAGSPVTYSMTISAIPDPSIYPNFEAHIFLNQDGVNFNPDNNSKDVAWLRIVDHSDGTATAEMHWKTNSAFNGTMLNNTQVGGQYGTNGYGAGFLGTLQAPSMVGTWSISFTSDTAFTVRGPGGVQTNFTIPQEWLTVWDADGPGGPSCVAYFGGDPNSANNQGQMFLSTVSVSGGASNYSLTNDFSAALDTTVWAVDGANIHVVLSPSWLVNWTLPANFYNLVATPSLAAPISWINLTNNPAVPVVTYTVGTNIHALVAQADMPDTNSPSTFFALRRDVALRVQVLMPGETNAPGTTTGKIGTPTAQRVGAPFNLTINATDANWHIMTSCVDVVNITSSDTQAGGTGPVTLTNGTATVSFNFGTTGAQTVTATDTVDATVADTGSSTTVNP